MTYEQFCTNYTPGRYAHNTTPAAVAYEAEVLERILNRALYNLTYALPIHRHDPRKLVA